MPIQMTIDTVGGDKGGVIEYLCDLIRIISYSSLLNAHTPIYYDNNRNTHLCKKN